MTQLDYQELDRLLDITKAHAFRNPRSSFFGSLACSMQYVWDEKEETAYTDFVTIGHNPHFFLGLPAKTRETVFMHELWHVALMHNIRRGNRDPEVWNQACDYYINNHLEKDKYSFIGIEFGLRDQAFISMSEEEIYDELMKNPRPQPKPNSGGSFGKGGNDMKDSDDSTATQQSIANVLRATHQAKMAGDPGHIPGSIESVISKFLEPVIPWETKLMKFFTDIMDNRRTWKKPNRRYQDMYLPGKDDDDGRLEHLIWYVDVSGSITDRDILRFHSEIKYIKEQLNPKKLTLVQFDTKIQHEKVFEEEDIFQEVKVIGRGGTSLVPVREHILKHNPTAAVIFSDLDVTPMQKLPYDIPLIWVATCSGGSVPSGEIIRIKS